MPRKGSVKPREIGPDLIYESVLVNKLINKIMLSGQKEKARKIVYNALKIVEEKTGKKGDVALLEVLEKARPLVELKPRRVGGATYQIPVEVEPQRGIKIALKWLVKYSRDRGEKTMVERLSKEMLDILSDQGATMKKRDETHKMAEANRAFAHFRW
ncbi:MAG TPA: 30S ribosomal protein S7 [Caldisericia bacterium]|nr:30S ribosomal protein S7 [Caldisericia bacterium]HPB33834.1 30S ribosomal protein S7 [Caldisericia bacterium]HQL67182.1 30S ribosomal protein S7 [Caldisericia bacterium]HQO99738.1 30S ribosomal protein S7 [Caldisericia bacterium]